jgi:predicted phosphoribosyltransferase
MFRDREDSGRLLARRLRQRELSDPLVLGIPRGGVAVGAALARELGADLDVVLARKLRAPWQPELALGAVSETGEVYLNPEAQDLPGVTPAYLAQERRFQLEEIARRAQLFREDRPPAPAAGRSVIVTDDGIATGSTMLAALRVLTGQQPRELIAAVPVGSPARLREVGKSCDEVVCLLRPEWFAAVGQFYTDFAQLTDEDVVELLRQFRRAAPA